MSTSRESLCILMKLIKLRCGWRQYPCQFWKSINYCVRQSVFYHKILNRTDLVPSVLKVLFKKFATTNIRERKLRTKWLIKLPCRKLQHVIFRCCNFRWPEIFWGTSTANVQGAISVSAACAGKWPAIPQMSTAYPGHYSTPKSLRWGKCVMKFSLLKIQAQIRFGYKNITLCIPWKWSVIILRCMNISTGNPV